MTTQPGLAAQLSTLGVLRVSGADARDFLQRILSNPVAVDTEHAEFGALCRPSGRTLSNFILYEWQDSLQLLLSLDLLTTVQAELNKYVLASRVRIQPAGLACLGLAGDQHRMPTQPMQVHGDPEHVSIRLPGDTPWHLLCGQSQTLNAIHAQAVQAGLPAGTDAAWTLLEISARLARISLACSDKHLPQALELDRLGGLDFNKGCYPGQEVVIRLQHRGTLKRRLCTLRSTQPLQAGAPVLQRTGGNAGEVVQAAPHPEGGSLALAVLTTAAMAQPLEEGHTLILPSNHGQ